jgi:hypothetical protein
VLLGAVQQKMRGQRDGPEKINASVASQPFDTRCVQHEAGIGAVLAAESSISCRCLIFLNGIQYPSRMKA